MVSVIPNAVVADDFQPLSHEEKAAASNNGHHTNGCASNLPSRSIARGPRPPRDPITIVVISRLFYNKGTDLLTAIIPRICASHPTVRFIIAGSGPKAIDLQQMIERNVLQERVEMLGPVRHEEVRDVMVRGHIYLHPSLTEAFGTVIVEAASCGLFVVCTQVGGIPEVLPDYMTSFARPEEDDLVRATLGALDDVRAGRVHSPERLHRVVQAMYSWTDVAERTERVYNGICGVLSEEDFYGYVPGRDDDDKTWGAVRGKAGVQSFALVDRLKRYYGCGIWAGKLFCICIVVDYLFYLLLEFLYPRDRIDVARDWPAKELKNVRVEHPDGGFVTRRRSNRYRER